MAEFLDFLYSHFPHRWLNKKAEGTKRLFNGLEKSIEYSASWVDIVKRNHSVRNADELVPELENEYGLSMNPSYDITFRKELIIARMRAQDSPVTKMDLIQMLATLGLEDCRIKNYHNEYRMTIQFKLPNDGQNRMTETRNLIEENIRAHIAFRFNAVMDAKVFNLNFISLHRFIISIYIQNLNIETIYLDGKKTLDGKWQLQTMDGCIHLNRMKAGVFGRNVFSDSQRFAFAMSRENEFWIETYLNILKNSTVRNDMAHWIGFYQGWRVKEEEKSTVSLIQDTMWRLEGEQRLDGKRRLNAEIVKMVLGEDD